MGALWIGTAYHRDGISAMTIYTNVSRGIYEGRWKRLMEFVGELDQLWDRFKAQ